MEGIVESTDAFGAGEVVVESFEGFYTREYRPVLAIALALTRSRAEAEDIAQEAFLATYRSWARIDNPSGWIRVAVTNRAMSFWRRVAVADRVVRRLSAPDPIEEIPDDTTEFWAVVRALPRRQAQVTALYYLEDRPTDEIASLLGIDASTVRLHLSRGRRALATKLGVSDE